MALNRFYRSPLGARYRSTLGVFGRPTTPAFPGLATLSVVTLGGDAFVAKQVGTSVFPVQRRSSVDGLVVWTYQPNIMLSGVETPIPWKDVLLHDGNVLALAQLPAPFNAGYLARLDDLGSQDWQQYWFVSPGDSFAGNRVAVSRWAALDEVLVLGSLLTSGTFRGRVVRHRLDTGARITEQGFPAIGGSSTVKSVTQWRSESSGAAWYSFEAIQATQKPLWYELLPGGVVWGATPTAGVVNITDFALAGGTIWACGSVEVASVTSAFVAAFDKTTGAVTYLSSLNPNRTYLAIDTDGTTIYVAGTGTPTGTSYPIAWAFDVSGNELWQRSIDKVGSTSPTGRDIAFAGTTLYLATNGQHAGGSLIRLDPTDGTTIWSV